MLLYAEQQCNSVAPMNVHLTRELEELIQKKVESGRYNSASEVMREALRLMEQRDEFLALRKEEVRQKIDEGLDSLARGEGVDGEAVFDRIEAELDALEQSRKK
jgi:antitoxin ParD1/3/4